jgi:hypothetical protein
MAETKYGKYVHQVPIGAEEIIKAFPKSAEQREPPPDMKNMDLSKVPPILNFVGSQAFGLNLGMIMIPISAPIKMESKPHSHDFDQLLCFLGSNPKNLKEFGAEIEFYLGEEGERHLITTPTIVYLKKGLIHCPLNYMKVEGTVYHLDIYLADEYFRKPKPE